MFAHVKLFVASVLFCAMGYAGYTAYERITMSETEKFMLNNIEALTMEEPGGGTGGGETPISGYFNKTKVIRNYSGCLKCEIESDAITPSVDIAINASGALTYCKKGKEKDKCYPSLNGFVKF